MKGKYFYRFEAIPFAEKFEVGTRDIDMKFGSYEEMIKDARELVSFDDWFELRHQQVNVCGKLGEGEVIYSTIDGETCPAWVYCQLEEDYPIFAETPEGIALRMQSQIFLEKLKKERKGIDN